MPARSVCLVALSLSEAGPGRFGGQVSVIDIYHTIPYIRISYQDRMGACVCVLNQRRGKQAKGCWP